MTIVFLNGQFIHQDEAAISVMDRGFLFGDGVYEVIPAYNAKLFRFDQHFKRLQNSLAAIHLDIDLEKKTWEDVFNELITANPQNGKNQSIYFQITRGTSSERSHAFPAVLSPTFFALSMPLKPVPLNELVNGKKAITLSDSRWEYCYIKSISLLANVLLYQQALDQGCAECILIRDEAVAEGATSNVFIVKDHVIKTPPLSDVILGGVTRDLVLELAHQHGLPCLEVAITHEELYLADEIWITSSTREIFPIVNLDGQIIRDGTPGRVWETMIRLYREFIQSL